ncbi:MAG: hypothetical protein K2K48_04020 [Anaeroplasmataceae bacterium]|nr:hypothetical protein [Anaeroplasmataceae bacterium]
MIFVNIIFIVVEILIIFYLIYMIKKDKKFSLKTTLVYPLLIILAIIVILTAKLSYQNEKAWYISLLESFSEALKTIKLDVNTVLLESLIKNDKFLLVDYLGLFVVSAISLISITFVIFKSIILNILKIKYFEKEITYIFGLSEEGKTYIRNVCNESDKTHKRQIVVVLKKTNISNYSDEKMFLNEQNIKYKICDFKDRQHYFKTISHLTKHLDKKKYNIISFYKKDKDIYEFVCWAQEYLKNNNLYKNNNIQFIISTDYNQKHIVNELITGTPCEIKNPNGDITYVKDQSHGKIRSFNKYDMISYDFLWKNNLAKYFPKELINDDCTINENVNVNLFVLGFGKVNQSMVRDILIDTQFVRKITNGSGTYKLSPVRLNVHIYDENEKLLNHEFSNGFMKYKKENYKDKLSDYFDLPEDYYTHIKQHFNKNTNEEYFISSLYDEIKSQTSNPNVIAVNYFLISLGSDFDNSLIARQIIDSLIEVDNIHNTIFVRTRESLCLPNHNLNNIVYFGDDKKILTFDNVVADQIYLSAKIESCIYNKKEATVDNITEIWSDISKIKQQSNLYSVATIPFKLSLLKLDDKDLSVNNFYERYDPQKRRDAYNIDEYIEMIKGTKEFHAIDVLAYLEHERWNAFELSQGVLPMKKSMLKKNESGKNVNEKYHINICSAQGLIEYFRETQKDVIKYDYDILNNFDKHFNQLNKNNTDSSVKSSK